MHSHTSTSHLLVHVLHAVGRHAVLDVAAELLLVQLLVLLDQVLHVVVHVAAENVGKVHVGVQLLGLRVVAGEALLGMADVQPDVDGSLHSG